MVRIAVVFDCDLELRIREVDPGDHVAVVVANLKLRYRRREAESFYETQQPELRFALRETPIDEVQFDRSTELLRTRTTAATQPYECLLELRFRDEMSA